MTYYSEELREEILNTADIVSVIGDYVKLTRAGTNYVGLCPFHKEKTGSFHVSPSKQIFKCFGCGAGGNVIHFVSKMDNLDYVETLESLSNKLNIDATKYQRNSGIAIDKDLKERLFNINKEVAHFCYNSLQEEIKKPESQVKKYLEKRQLDINTVVRFGLGFQNKSKKNEGIYAHLIKLGYSKEEILKSGVVTISASGEVYEWLQNRLIFPIIDTRDRVIGFGGRVLDNSLPKYINSPENIVYYKGNNLFGLNVARKQKLEYIILTEGYMDTVALHKSGITCAVASLGTALTENQAQLIKKNAPLCIISYDQDSAGQKATLRAIDILLAQGLKVKVLRLDHNDAKDPDEYINKYGVDKFLECVKKSQSYVEYKVEKAQETIDTANFDDKLTFLNAVVEVFSKIENEIERDMYMTDISKKFNIDKNVVKSEIKKKTNKNSIDMQKEENKKIMASVSVINKKQRMNSPRNKQEQYIIALLCLKDSKIAKYIFEHFVLEDFEDDILRQIYSKLRQLDFEEKNLNILSNFDSEQEISKITEIMYIDLSQFDMQKLVKDLERSFKQYRYSSLRDNILKKMNDINTGEDEKQMLSIELSELIKKMAKRG